MQYSFGIFDVNMNSIELYIHVIPNLKFIFQSRFFLHCFSDWELKTQTKQSIIKSKYSLRQWNITQNGKKISDQNALKYDKKKSNNNSNNWEESDFIRGTYGEMYLRYKVWVWTMNGHITLYFINNRCSNQVHILHRSMCVCAQ